MIRRKTTLRSKSGGFSAQNGNGNGNPRALVDEIVYREHWSFINAIAASDPPQHWDPQYSGWSNGSRSKDHEIFLRAGIPVGGVIPPGGISLGSAVNFAIFGSTAGVTSGGSDVVTGDVGADFTYASLTGWSLTPPVPNSATVSATSAQISGLVYASDYPAGGTPAKVGQAATDILAAYTTASGKTPTTTLVSGEIGGRTLTAGVYAITGANGTITTNLVLNGPGIFIIQVAGTLSVAAAASISLTGGAVPANVFFAVGGAVTMTGGGTNTFQGELLGATSIAVQAGVTVIGRLLAGTAVTLGAGVTVTKA